MSEAKDPANAGTENGTETGGDKTPSVPSTETTKVEAPKTKAKDPAKNPSPPPAPPVEKKKSVRVIVEKGTLGPLLLVNGDITDDPDYVALLEVKGQKKVELVK